MAKSFTERKRIRKSFGRIDEITAMPNLIELQKTSYDKFLQIDTASKKRTNTGLQGVFKNVFPIKDFSGKAELDFVSYEFEAPKYDVEECQHRGLTYSAPLRVTMRLSVFDVNEDTGTRTIRDIKEQEIYMMDMPLMTSNGTFVVNGIERVIVSQVHRSPGVFFEHDAGRNHASGKYLFSARIIPYRGAWLDFEFDAKDFVYFRIDRKRKIPVSTLLYALYSAETEQYLRDCKEKDLPANKDMITGMSKEEILNYFYSVVNYKRHKKTWKTAFKPEAMKGIKLAHDLIDAESGDVVVASGEKLTPRKLKEIKISEMLVSEKEIEGRYLASDIINPETGEVLFEAGDELTEESLKQLETLKVKEISVLDIDHFNVGAYIRDTLVADKNITREDALIDIYRVMRPGEPPTLESAESLFYHLFFDNP